MGSRLEKWPNSERDVAAKKDVVPKVSAEQIEAKKTPAGKEIKKETQEKISREKEKLPLFSRESLDKIWVTPNEANTLAEKVLGKDFTKEKIMSFQKEHFLWIDWKIGKETYVQLVLNQAFKGVEKPNVGLSQDSMGRIMGILENGKKSDKDVIKVMAFLEQFKKDKKELIEKDEKHKEFFWKVDKIIWDFKNSPEWEKALKDAKKYIDSIYWTLKDPNLSSTEKAKKILTDPTLLLAGWILFLFWVFWSNSKYTNSFMKRAGWIFGGILLGPAIWNKFWFSEMIDDATKLWVKAWEKASELSNKMKEQFWSGFESGKEKVWDKFKEGFNLWAVWVNLETFFSDSYDKISSWMNDYNESLKNVDGGVNYIETEKLNTLRDSIFTDEQFLNKRKSDLISSSAWVNLLSESTKSELVKKWIFGKDVNIFIKKHILENSMKNLWEEDLVRKIFMTEEMRIKIDELLTKHVVYSESPKLNENIRQQVIIFTNASWKNKEQMQQAWRDLIKVISSWEVEKFYLWKYNLSWDSRAQIAFNNIKEYVEADRQYLEATKKIVSYTKSLEDYKYIWQGNSRDSENTIKSKYEDLVAKEIEFNNYVNSLSIKWLEKTDFVTSSFETEVYDIKVELLSHLDSKISFWASTAWVLLAWLEGEKSKIETQKQIDSLKEVPEVPELIDSERKFERYLNDNLEIFRKASKLDQNNPKIRWIMDRFDTLVFRLQEKLNEREAEIKKIWTEIDTLKINKDTSSVEVKSRLDQLKQKFEWFALLYFNVKAINFKKFFEVLLEGRTQNNPYMRFDEQIKAVDETKTINWEALETSIMTLLAKFSEVKVNIFSHLKINVDFWKVDIYNKAQVQKELGKIEDLNDFIWDLDISEVLEQAKIDELNAKIKELVDKYIEAVKNSDLDWLKVIKNSYNENVFKYLRWKNVFIQLLSSALGDLDSWKGEFDKAYNERVEKIIGEEKIMSYEKQIMLSFDEKWCWVWKLFADYKAFIPEKTHKLFDWNNDEGEPNINNITLQQLIYTVSIFVKTQKTEKSKEFIKYSQDVLNELIKFKKTLVTKYTN